MTDSGAKILIIDDDKDFLEIFSTKLKSAGFDVTTAHGGEAGLKEAKELKPQLILLDVEMPGMSGVEVLSHLKGTSGLEHTKISFLTNYGEPTKEAGWLDEKFAREAGAADYIKKSEDLDDLVKEVKKILGDKGDE